MDPKTPLSKGHTFENLQDSRKKDKYGSGQKHKKNKLEGPGPPPLRRHASWEEVWAL